MPGFHELIEAIPIIISLIIIEGLLSVDNALAIAAMASHLPGDQKYRALRWGIVGAYVFRAVALAFAAFIIENPWLKIVGAAYLVHLMASYLSQKKAPHGMEEAAGEGGGDDEATIATRMAGKGFWATVVSIELMDLSLSVDNVVAAVAMSPKMWVVCTGVFIGILALRFVAGYCIQLIRRYPVLEPTAFILIGYVGGILIVELCAHQIFGLAHPVHVSALQKFIGIVLILGVAIWYSESPTVKKVLSPIFKVALLPLKGYALLTSTLLAVVFFPFKGIPALFKDRDSVAQKPVPAREVDESADHPTP